MTKMIQFPVSPGPRYFIRVHPETAGGTGTVTVQRTLTPRLVPIGFEADYVDETPASLPISIAGGTPNLIATFTVDDDPTILGTARLDSDGNLIGSSVFVPELPMGNHILKVSFPNGQLGEVTFLVRKDPTQYPAPLEVDQVLFDVGEITPARPVLKWRILDLTPPIDEYTFEVNPDSMSSPHSARIYTQDHTTSPVGQDIVFEGNALAQQWDVAGSSLTMSQYEALEHYKALNRRMLVVDHLGRGWICLFEALDWTPKPTPTPWQFSYKAKFLIMDGPFVGRDRTPPPVDGGLG